MKKLIEGRVIYNRQTDADSSVEFIISHFPQVQHDENGKTIWADEKNNIAHCKGRAESVKFFNQNPDKSFTEVIIPADVIKKLHKAIHEIEETKTKETIDY